MSSDGPIFGKFIIERADGKHLPGEKHDDCEYFVLDVTHDPYAMPALRAYAIACERTHPELREDIIDRWLFEVPCVPDDIFIGGDE